MCSVNTSGNTIDAMTIPINTMTPKKAFNNANPVLAVGAL